MSDLAGHYADGRLDHEEYDERLDAIWTARTRADLAVLFSDLPRPQATYPPGQARPAARLSPQVWPDRAGASRCCRSSPCWSWLSVAHPRALSGC